MKYSILGFNQEKVIDAGLDITDLLILQYIGQACASTKMKHIVNDEEVSLVWVSHTKFHEDMPIINIAEGTFRNKLSNLKKLGFLQSQTITNAGMQGSCTYYGYTDKTDELLYNNECTCEQTGSLQNDMVDEPCHSRMTSYNKLNSNSKLEKNILNNKLFNTEKVETKKSKKKNQYQSCNEYIMQYTNNIVLQDTLDRFLRCLLEKKNKDPNFKFWTNQWPSIVNELDSLAASTDEAIKIVNQSIQCNWNRFYPLKTNKKSAKSDPSERNVVSDKKDEEELHLSDTVY